MAENKTIRLNKVLRELNISLDRAVEHLGSKGIEIESRPTAKITAEVYNVLSGEFQTDASKKVASKEVGEEKRKEKEALRLEREQEEERKRLAELKKQEVIKAKAKLEGPKTVGNIDLDADQWHIPFLIHLSMYGVISVSTHLRQCNLYSRCFGV